MPNRLPMLRSGLFLLLTVILVTGARAGPLDEAPKKRICKGTGAMLPKAPFELRYHFNVGREHGCSRSMESFGEVGELNIAVDAGGKATFKLDLFHSHTFGPSLGSYKQGKRDFSHNDSRVRIVWKGKHKKVKNGFVLQFSKKEISKELWGSDFKPELIEKTGLEVTCQVDYLLLDPKDLDAKKAAKCTPVVLCKPDSPILKFLDDQVRELSAKLYYNGQLPFAAKPGLDASIKKFYSHDWDYLHKAGN
jgi:hypothetical protein